MRNDLLQVTTVSKAGKWSKRTLKGAAYLTVTKGFNEPSNQIAIEVTHTSGVGSFKTEHSHPEALINITFKSGRVWSGTFSDLENLIILGS